MLSRELWADGARAFAVFCVIAVHAHSYPISIYNGGIWILPYLAVVKTCVPIFVILSGIFLLTKMESYQLFFRKRFSRVLFPWLFWTTVLTLIFALKNNNFNIHTVLGFFRHQLSGFWFIPLILALYLITPMLRVYIRSAKKNDIFYVLILWFLAISVLPYYGKTAAFTRLDGFGIVKDLINYFGYFLYGYFFIKYSKTILNPVATTTMILGGVIWTCAEVILNGTTKNGNIIYSYFDFNPPGIVITSIAIVHLFYNCKSWFDKESTLLAKHLISFISKSSLGIYLIQYAVLEYLPVIQVTPYPIINALMITFIAFILATLLIGMLSRLRILNKFIR